MLQRVLYDGAEMPPSKFEAICGKADAKKWKSSLWLEGPDGEPVEVRRAYVVLKDEGGGGETKRHIHNL